MPKGHEPTVVKLGDGPIKQIKPRDYETNKHATMIDVFRGMDVRLAKYLERQRLRNAARTSNRSGGADTG